MNEWKTIDSAPKDGTRILLTNGVVYTDGYWTFWEEPQFVYEFSPLRQVPNKKYPHREYFWALGYPIAFDDKEEILTQQDYDGEFPRWDPTHWSPLLNPPK